MFSLREQPTRGRGVRARALLPFLLAHDDEDDEPAKATVADGGEPVAGRTEILLPQRAGGHEDHCGKGLPSTGELFANGNIKRGGSEPSPFQSALLFPTFSVPLSDDGNGFGPFTEALQSAQKKPIKLLCPPLDALRPEAPTGKAAKDGSASLLRPALASARGETFKSAAAVDEDEAVSSVPPFTYRSVTISVDIRWLSSYLADYHVLYSADSVGHEDSYGAVSSMADTLDLLWPEFRTEAKGKHSTYHSLLGCYNLPREPMADALFWKNGWGSPARVYYYAMQLIETYIDMVKPEKYPRDGFQDFIETLFQGKEAENDVGETCTLTINYRNTDERWDYVTEPCDRDVRRVKCSDGFNIDKDDYCGGKKYELFDDDRSWNSTENCYQGRSDETCGLPFAGCARNGLASTDFMVTLEVVHLAWRGWLCDVLIFWARIGLDYALYLMSVATGAGDLLSAERALRQAQRMARYALRLIAGHAYTMIHELGHVKFGGGHCENNCCMNMARVGWLCQVRAHLGLPRQELEMRATDDYKRSASYTEDVSANCTEGEFSWWCDTDQEGVAGSEASFCVTNCLGDDGDWSYKFCHG